MIRILIVDDELLMIDGIVAMLSDQADIQVVGKATTAASVLPLALELKPDIVILDVLMNDGHGVAITHKLKKAIPELKIIGCSTCLAPRTIEAMLKAGARAYLTKSENEGVLEAAVRSMAKDDPVYLSPRTILAMNDDKLKLDKLTEREREVLAYLCRDIIPKVVAREMGISVKTVYNHIDHICEKAGVTNLIQLYPVAIREGLIESQG